MSKSGEQKPLSDLTHEVVMNIGGKATVACRCNEKDAVRTAKALGIPFNGLIGTLWPITIRRIGNRQDVEANALAQALAPKLVVPEGQVMLFAVGVDTKEDPPEHGFDWLDAETALVRLTELLHGEHAGRVWSILTAETGTVITKPTQ